VPPRDGAGRVYDGINDAPEFTDYDTWPAPDRHLVSDDRPAAPLLETDALPAGWGGWVMDEAAARGCPGDYLASSLITATSGLIGNARHVRATATWTEPPHLWMANIGAPSTGKTPGQLPLIEASRTIERDAEPAWQAACAAHVMQTIGAKELAEAWEQDVRKAAKDGTPLPPRPPGADVPDAPTRPRVVMMDTTTEELQRVLAGQPRGLLYVRDELSGWLGNHDRYGGKGGDRAFFLECWNGGPYVVDRVKFEGRPLRIERAALAILGGMQPDKLREALSGSDDGLAERLVYVWPDPVPITSLSTEADHIADNRRAELLTAARRLAGLLMDKHDDTPVPCILRLDPAAFALFEELRREAMELARASRGLAAGWHGKTPGRALRLALVFELLAWARTGGQEPRAVGGDAMARAGAYLDYLSAMLDRVTAGLAISGAEADAAVIGREILSTGCTRLNERELYQRQGWAWARDTERRAAALRVLASAGWIRSPPQTTRGRPKGDWDVSPKLHGRMP
jgi:hypothetical protein